MPDFGILTVSTTCAQFPDKDIAGPKLENQINKTFENSSVVFKGIVTDDVEEIVEILERVCDGRLCDILFTVGGTGFAASDVTPEATKMVIDKETPGLTYAMISRSLDSNCFAAQFGNDA